MHNIILGHVRGFGRGFGLYPSSTLSLRPRHGLSGYILLHLSMTSGSSRSVLVNRPDPGPPVPGRRIGGFGEGTRVVSRRRSGDPLTTQF